jgi:hypothetical protein
VSKTFSSGGGVCSFHVQHGSATEDSATLLDLRSRALLAVNSDTAATEEAGARMNMQPYLDLVKESQRISSSVTQLCALGHFTAR